MANFIHISDEKNKSSIARNGIKLGNKFSIPRLNIKDQRAIFSVPLTNNYQFNHQWMREVKRHQNFCPIAVVFSIPDNEMIWIRNYNEQPLEILAKNAVQYVQNHGFPMGLESVIFSKIEPSQIKKIYYPPKVVGWRYYPNAHGKKPSPYLQRGEPFSNKISQK